MAAITALASVDKFPAGYTVANVGTTWQEFTLPDLPGPLRVSVYGASQALYVAWTEDGAADGGAVSATRRVPVGSASWASFSLPAGGMRSGSVFVAAQTGTTDVAISVEG